MTTYWLYIGNKLITSVRCENESQAIRQALKTHASVPCCSALFPAHTPAEIRNLIIHSEVRQ